MTNEIPYAVVLVSGLIVPWLVAQSEVETPTGSIPLIF